MLTNLTPLFLEISTLYNSTKTDLNYINKGLFYSLRIGQYNKPLFIKYRAILVVLLLDNLYIEHMHRVYAL